MSRNWAGHSEKRLPLQLSPAQSRGFSFTTGSPYWLSNSRSSATTGGTDAADCRAICFREASILRSKASVSSVAPIVELLSAVKAVRHFRIDQSREFGSGTRHAHVSGV